MTFYEQFTQLTKACVDETIILGMKRRTHQSVTAVFLVLTMLSAFSCSLDYSVSQAENAGSPEFVFSDAEFTRIEDRKSILTLHADTIEQYVSDSTMYGNDLTFKAFKDDGSISVQGSCDLFSGNTDTGEYYFLDNVELESFTHNMFLKSEDVFWNNRTNQLVSSRDTPVIVKKTGDSEINITGEQFSASGFSSSYRFAGPVSGTIVTGDSNEDE